MLKNKRILLIGLALLLLILIPNIVNATEATETTSTSTGTTVKWSYELSGDSIKDLKCTNTASISGDLTIPTTIDEHTVTSLGNRAFEDAAGLTNVIIPEGVTSIGAYAFFECSGLRNITIPEGVTSIGDSAFYRCSGLTSVTIPNTVTSLESCAFKYCTALNNITLSDNLTIIKSGIFAFCSSLKEIVLPENITTIDDSFVNDGAFEYCKALQSIKISESVVSIGDSVFNGCPNLTIYGVEGSNAQIYAKNKNINFEKIENWDKRNESKNQKIDTTTYISFPFIIYNGKSSVSLKSGVYDGKYTMHYQFVEISNETYNKIKSLQDKYKNGEITYEEYFVQYNQTVTKYNNSKWVKTEDGSFEQDLSKFTGTKKFALWIKLEMEDKTVYESQVYTMDGAGRATNTQEQQDKIPSSSEKTDTQGTNNKKDTTVATSKLPYTGKIILAWIIGIIAVSGIVAHVRYKKLYM